MRELARAGAHHPEVIAAAHDVVRTVPERNDRATMGALLRNVRQRMRYTADPINLELVKAPWVSLAGSDQGGKEPMDCDDVSVLLSSMLGAVGIPSRFKVAATDRRNRGAWSHVYVEARDGRTGEWVPLDPIVRDFGVGDEVPDADLTGPRRSFPGALDGVEQTSAEKAIDGLANESRQVLQVLGVALAVAGGYGIWRSRRVFSRRRRRS